MAIPIFAEIELFGVKLSQVMREVKAHVTSEVESVKATIVTSIENDISNKNS